MNTSPQKSAASRRTRRMRRWRAPSRPPPGGEVAARIAHQAVTSALVDLHDALIALETI